MKIISEQGIEYFDLDTSGEQDVSIRLQQILDGYNERGIRSISIYFLPGKYKIENPVTFEFISIKMTGEAHGGVDIHGMNLASGTTFMFTKSCGPNCFTFVPSGEEVSFPAKEKNWKHKTTRVAIEHLNFVGHNNTDVDTQAGYSRFRGDEPNFRGLRWYPMKDRYTDVENEGQRAIVIDKQKMYEKPEMLSVESCYFTDLYVGLDIANVDVSNIRNSWFGQLVYGVRYHGSGQCIMMNDNCFADLETAVNLTGPQMSTIHNNTFAYVSKCFELHKASEVSISSNVVKNWDKAVGTAPCGAFLYANECINLNVNSNTIHHGLDSRVKTITVDERSNGRYFIQFEKCKNVMFLGNLVDTRQTQAVVFMKACERTMLRDNLICYAEGGCEQESDK